MLKITLKITLIASLLLSSSGPSFALRPMAAEHSGRINIPFLAGKNVPSSVVEYFREDYDGVKILADIQDEKIDYETRRLFDASAPFRPIRVLFLRPRVKNIFIGWNICILDARDNNLVGLAGLYEKSVKERNRFVACRLDVPEAYQGEGLMQRAITLLLIKYESPLSIIAPYTRSGRDGEGPVDRMFERIYQDRRLNVKKERAGYLEKGYDYEAKRRYAEFLCEIPNVKGGPDIKIRYSIHADYYLTDGFIIIEGTTQEEADKRIIGTFRIKIFPRAKRISILEYFPIGTPSSLGDWRNGNYKGKGISDTFLSWLSCLAAANSMEIYIDSPHPNNYHIFAKHFVDKIRVTIPKNEALGTRRWMTLEEINDADKGKGFYSYEVMGNVAISDVKTFLRIAYADLKRVEGTKDRYRIIRFEDNRDRLARQGKEDGKQELYIPERYADGLGKGVVVRIDEKSSVWLGDDLIGNISECLDAKLEMKGIPKISKNRLVKAEAVDFELPGKGSFKFKILRKGAFMSARPIRMGYPDIDIAIGSAA